MKSDSITHIPKFDPESLKNAISNEYTEVACNQDHQIHFVSGSPLARRLSYPESATLLLPEEAVRPFAGVGNPFKIGAISPEEILLDVGCGAGFDILMAWLSGSRKNKIYGLDMTEAMLQKARENARKLGALNIDFLHANAENIPLPDASVDVVISNGVINLCPDKLRVYREIFRVLKPGGRFQIADVILKNSVPDESRELVHLWTNCVAGGIPLTEYLNIIRLAGFSDIRVLESFHVFKDARIAKSAARFGAKGYNLRGIKPS